MAKVLKLRYLLPIILASLIVIGAVIAYFWWNSVNQAPGNVTSEKRFVIKKGTGASEIALQLKDNGFIRNSFAFKLYVQLTGKSDKILAGEYNLSQNLPLAKLVDILTQGPTQVWVTIPEGLRKEEIASRFASGLGLSQDQQAGFITSFLSVAKDKEGYLFPDTYLFPRDITPEKIVARMTDVFKTRFNEVEKEKQGNLSTEEIVIMASLIEREAKAETERPVIAGIMLNRIENSWPLQVDASIQYAIANLKLKSNPKFDNYWESLTRDDLDINSPYNSYKNTGFPPTPISNPGLSSLKAAASPATTTYFYYLHDNNGQIHYAETLEEHNQNVRQYLGK